MLNLRLALADSRLYRDTISVPPAALRRVRGNGRAVVRGKEEPRIAIGILPQAGGACMCGASRRCVGECAVGIVASPPRPGKSLRVATGWFNFTESACRSGAGLYRSNMGRGHGLGGEGAPFLRGAAASR